jgi:hypothetical protein
LRGGDVVVGEGVVAEEFAGEFGAFAIEQVDVLEAFIAGGIIGTGDFPERGIGVGLLEGAKARGVEVAESAFDDAADDVGRKTGGAEAGDEGAEIVGGEGRPERKLRVES